MGPVTASWGCVAALAVCASAWTPAAVSGDVGGNFGIRNSTCPEFALVAWAARRVGRPVKWICDRHDAFATDFHGRDLTSEAELALDEDGRFLALRATKTSNLGVSAISSCHSRRGSRSPPASTTSLARTCAAAQSSPTWRRPRPIAALMISRRISPCRAVIMVTAYGEDNRGRFWYVVRPKGRNR